MSERELRPKTACKDCGNAVVFEEGRRPDGYKCLVCDEWMSEDGVTETPQNNISLALVLELAKIPFKHIRRSI